MGSQPCFNLSWVDYSSSLSVTAQSLHRHGDLVDVTLAAGGKIFPAHKLILSSASPLLMELLKSTKCEHPVVMLAGITAHDLEALLHFIYYGEVSVDPNRLSSLLQAAQCLDIQALAPTLLTPAPDKVTSAEPVPQQFQVEKPLQFPPLVVKKKRGRVRANSTDKPVDQDSQNKDETSADKENAQKKSPLTSDLPVSCQLCGVTLRQSRNLRRHMELIHMKMDGSGKRRKKMKKSESLNNLTNTTSTVDTHELVASADISLASMTNRLVDTAIEDDQHASLNHHIQQAQPPAPQLQLSHPQVTSPVVSASQPIVYATPATAALVADQIHSIYSQSHMVTSIHHLQQFSPQQFRQPSTLYQEPREQHT